MQSEDHMKKIAIRTLSLISILCVFALYDHLPLRESGYILAHDETAKKLKRWAYLIGDKRYYQHASYLNRAFSRLDIVSVTGFRINGVGTLSISIKKGWLDELLQIAKKYNTEIYPLITLRSVSDGRIFLSNSNARKAAIVQINNFLTMYDLQGIHIDFEYLSPDYATKLAAFFREMKPALGERKLTMAVFPSVDFPFKYHGFHNLKLLACHLDEIVLMCYDYHRSGTRAGPVTDLGWAERNVKRTLQFMPPDAVWLGVPAYGYIWDELRRVSVITARRGVELAERYKAVRHRSGTIFIEFRQGGAKKQIYFSDSETRRRMSDLAQRYKLRGTALWRLGFEDD
jgi:spore germination protein YaaH